MSINWNTTASASSIISFGTSHLHVSIAGPPRQLNTPVILCEAGHGSSGSTWLAVQRLASPFARVLWYDRAGYGSSSSAVGTDPRTASRLAGELTRLLATIDVPGPYVLLCHSWGGVVGREFYAQNEDHVQGIVFVDVVTERMFEGAVPDQNTYAAVTDGFDSHEVIGLDKEHKLQPDEWTEVCKIGRHAGRAWKAEFHSLRQSAEELGSKRQHMGDRPLVVIKGDATRDIRKVCKAGTDAGNGTPRQRKVLELWMQTGETVREEHQRELLGMSTNSRYVVARQSGHNVQLTEPELVVEQLRWVLSAIKQRKENDETGHNGSA